VVEEAQNLEKMLKISGGVRQVPVLVEEGRVKIGFGGS
jgi:glutaredoxin